MRLRERDAQQPGSVEADIRFVGERGVTPRIDATNPARTVLPLISRTTRFENVRRAAEPPSLAREGFALLPHRTSVEDFDDPSTHAQYCREIDRLLREVTGAEHVFVSPTLVLRSRDHSARGKEVVADHVAGVVHSDRTDQSAWIEARWALDHYGAAPPPAGRLVSYNVWRALTPPPQDFPLALCDLRTVHRDAIVRGVSIGNPANRGLELEFCLSLPDSRQRWCYAPMLTRDEVLVFQQFDSAADGPSGCLHTAFRDPSVTHAAVTRLSVEARAYVFHER